MALILERTGCAKIYRRATVQSDLVNQKCYSENLAMSGEELRKILFQEFVELFGASIVRTKWHTAKSSQDSFDRRSMYAPEADIAIGPFNTDTNITRNNELIDRCVRGNKDLLSDLYSLAENRQSRGFERFVSNELNPNPRCFLAIEVGGSGSMKHCLGDIVNASMIGKIGLVVGANDRRTRIYRRIFEYVNFAYQVRKTPQHFRNVLILSGDRLLSYLRDRRVPDAVRVLGWSRGSANNVMGAGYGIRVTKKDRDRFFKKSWSSVVVELESAVSTTVRLSPAFWKECCELRNAEIGKWMIRNGFAPWPKGKPPIFSLEDLGEARFRLTHPQAVQE